MIIKDIHEKLLQGIKVMLIDTRINLPYYGEFNLHVNFHEQDSIGTCAVNVSSKGMNFFYSPKFLENMSQKEVNFITLHEDFHLLFDHPKRTVTGQYDHKMSNIVQDMIINHIIWEDITHEFVEIPKDKTGKNMALFVPKEYTGKLIFEELYEWMKDEKEKWQKQQKCNSQCKSCNGTGKKQDQDQKGQGKKDGQKQDGQGKGQGEQPQDQKGQGEQPGDGQGQGQDNNQQDGGDGQGQSQSKGQGKGGQGQGQDPCDDCGGTGNEGGKDSTGKPSYGPYGKNPSGKDKDGAMDTWSKEQIFQDMENNNGEYMDKHINDEVPEDMREAMVRDVMEKLAARGLSAGNIETTLNKLRKKRKDYLKEIKRAVSNMIFGTTKQKTIVKPNRRQISGLKGNRKVKTKINVILDTSGSMGGQGTFERVLSYVYRNDIEINFIESDTEIKWVERIKTIKKLESLPIKGLGGTIMQTGIDYVVEHFNDCNTVLLTDGYTDSLDLGKLKGKLLIISVGTKVPIARTNGKVKQIVLEGQEK
jgi:predicted metal-dependent peptidase